MIRIFSWRLTLITPIIATDTIPETLENFNHLMWLMTGEDFIKVSQELFGKSFMQE
jgi:hypothetical protein